MKNAKIAILASICDFVNAAFQQVHLYTFKPGAFSRKSKMNFFRLVFFLVSSCKRSLCVELRIFFQSIGLPEQECTKSALSQQRQKLSVSFFEQWNELLIQLIYTLYAPFLKYWRSYRLLAIDGSQLYMFGKKELIDYFGLHSNHHSSVVMAQGCFCYDVLNGYCLRSAIEPTTTSERTIAMSWIKELCPSDVALYDRGFGGFAMFYLHEHGFQQRRPYIIRCQTGKNSTLSEIVSFLESKKKEELVEIALSWKGRKVLEEMGYELRGKESVKVRLVRVELRNGETEVLATNLFDEKRYPVSCFKGVYAKRWGVGTGIGYWKNTCQIEHFSGHTLISVLQDFIITIFNSNMHSFLGQLNRQKLKRKTKNRVYKCKVNRNVTCQLVKQAFVELYLGCLRQANNWLDNLENSMLKYLQPVIAGRYYLRDKKKRLPSAKYYTLTNYKRAF